MLYTEFHNKHIIKGILTAVDPLHIGAASKDSLNPIEVDNAVLKDAAGKNWTLSDELVVYVEDADGNWSVGKESAMTARKDKLASISLVDADADGEYDIAIVVKK